MNQHSIKKLQDYGIQYKNRSLEEILSEVLLTLDDTKKDLDIVKSDLEKYTKSEYLFKLNDIQTKEYNAWKEKINDLMGSYGTYTFIFSPTSIGTCVKVHSDLINRYLDISHEETW